MWASMFYGHFDLWELQQKVTFDPILRLMTIGPEITEINVRVDLYSDFKEWHILPGNNRYKPGIRAVGGDPIDDVNVTGTTFFMTNGWRIVADHSVNFDGNLYSDDYDSPFFTVEGVSQITQKVSTLVEVATPNIDILVPSAEEIADAVWSRNVDIAASTPNSTGEYLRDKLLTVKKFLSLG